MTHENVIQLNIQFCIRRMSYNNPMIYYITGVIIYVLNIKNRNNDLKKKKKECKKNRFFIFIYYAVFVYLQWIYRFNQFKRVCKHYDAGLFVDNNKTRKNKTLNYFNIKTIYSAIVYLYNNLKFSNGLRIITMDSSS